MSSKHDVILFKIQHASCEITHKMDRIAILFTTPTNVDSDVKAKVRGRYGKAFFSAPLPLKVENHQNIRKGFFGT